ncbi:hypothetical protein KGM_213477B, partial [Danaus plexippus plexippus]
KAEQNTDKVPMKR